MSLLMLIFLYPSHLVILHPTLAFRPDDKTARDFSITAGAVLHLVLALRGGC